MSTTVPRRPECVIRFRAHGERLARRGSRSATLTALVALSAVVSCVAACSDAGAPNDVIAATRATVTVARTVEVSGDTYTRSGAPNSNQGSEPIIRLQSAGKNRGLLFFDKAAILASVSGGTLTAAQLELVIDSAGTNWGTAGRPIAVHRLKQASSEYGATHNCAIDASIANSQADCAASDGTSWAMDATDSAARPWVDAANATTTITNAQTGTVTFDVTADVAAILSGSWAGYGFLLKKVNESENGQVDFKSRERSPSARLVLHVDVADAGSSGAGGSGAAIDAGVRSPLLGNAHALTASEFAEDPFCKLARSLEGGLCCLRSCVSNTSQLPCSPWVGSPVSDCA